VRGILGGGIVEAMPRRILSPIVALAALAGCQDLMARPGEAPRQPPGQWQQPGQAPMAQPVQPGPGQWMPPPQQQNPALPWWPQGGQLPVPGVGPLPIPSIPALPGMPVGAPQQCVDGINQYRQRHGLAPLQRWYAGEACAATQAQSDAQSGQPHGSFGRCSEGAQNVCPGWQGPAEQMTGPCLQSMYNEGPGADFARHGHYLNMMNARFTKVACGYFTTAQGQVWAVQDFQ
jgi:hypothetical protein